MKNFFTLALLMVFGFAKAQLLTTSPNFIQETSSSIVITADATKGNQGLKDYTPTTDVYVHIGAITNKSTTSSDWKYLPYTSFTTATPAANCASIGNNKWTFTINTSLRTFFGITDPSETIMKIAILFRSGNGSKKLANADGSDMYITLYDANLNVRIDAPPSQPLFTPVIEPITKIVGDPLSITANASQASTLALYFNGTLLTTANSATTASFSTNITAVGNQQIVARATVGATTKSDTLNFVVAAPNTIAALPSGLKDGINYDANDNTSATLVLYAPNKSNVFAIGDFNNWQQTAPYQMNVTPDGLRYWIKLTGLTPTTEYAFQYVIDGNLKVADYTSEKVLDPFNDQYISSTTYPNLKPYPTGKTNGIVGVLQTAKPAYNWQVTNFTRPNKRNLIIYELLVRDFTAAQDWKTTKDSIPYLKRLGINAIELMPVIEFEGNNSWGYNPSFFFAPDKAYGTDVAFKQFIDACHANGIAVIMDIAMNHAFGESPLVKMYWDATNSRPAANSPWFNAVATHPYNVGYDFNHESQATKDLVDNVLTHWLTNYKIDGFRWDLSKGFTQTNSGSNVGQWGNYDLGRINTWKRIYNKMQAVSPNSYCILEHFADNNEETELANYGMMLWGNMAYGYQQATMGYSNGSDLSYSVAANKGWNDNNLVAYQESHDEERLMYQNLQYGNVNGSYSAKVLSTATKRNAMAAAIWAMIPGPKMMWQFGELGYDYSINTCPNLSVSNNCRTDPKPVKWDYLQNTDRKDLFDVYSKLFTLRNAPQYTSTFTTGTIANNYDLTGNVKQLRVIDPNLSVVAYGNFGVTTSSFTLITCPNGTWYNYLNPSATPITITSGAIVAPSLEPGEYYVYTNKDAYTAILPVTWISFTAQKHYNNAVHLQWQVANEVYNHHYEVERSTNGVNFTSVGTVASLNDNTQAATSYSFVDKQPAVGTAYYRIQQVDKDGKHSYSSVQTITVNATEIASWKVYPTLSKAGGNATLHIKGDVGKIQLVLTDISGKIIYQNKLNATVAGQQINVPLNGCTKGIYMLKIVSDKALATEKIVVE
ncbi:MAG: alpha-amylase family glycosyl hydrolase [Flavobacterium sp.]|nr:alpha-amylase family glycosyl hydrolase [Flavobacterium sp.]